MTAFHAVLAFVAAQRGVELWLSARNANRLKREGGVEVGQGHYPLFFLVHGAWFASLVFGVPTDAALRIWALALFVLVQIGRVWVMVSLGRYWTTRVITLPGRPLVRRGPYRLIRHPNYAVVVAEIALVPMIASAWWIAVVFSVLNGLLLAQRVRVENRALAPRRDLPSDAAI